MGVDNSINKLTNILNKLTNKSYLTVKITRLSSWLLETSKTIENCTSCKDKLEGSYHFYEFYKSTNEIEYLLDKLEQEGQKGEEKRNMINDLSDKLIKMDSELNEWVLCEGCRGKKSDKSADKCGNKEIAKFLYKCKLDSYGDNYIRWIPFDEFRNIEYLAKGGFGEIHRATWTNYVYGEKDVVLKRIYNCSNKILNILKEVKQL